MHSIVDFQVDWPKLLFKSRHQIPCRDIIHVATSISCRDINSSLQLSTGVIHVATSISRRDINLSLCSFQPVSSDVATSISCRDITLCLCRFQLVVHDVATTISYHDINLKNCNLQLSTSIVATSISCRDVSLCLWRLQLRLQSSVATTASVTSVSFFQTCHSFKALLLSRPPSLIATSTFVATSLCCRDIIP